MVLRTRTARSEGALSLPSFALAARLPSASDAGHQRGRQEGRENQLIDDSDDNKSALCSRETTTRKTLPPQKGIGADNKSSLIESGDAQGEPHTTIPRVRGKRTHHTEKYSPERLPQRGTT